MNSGTELQWSQELPNPPDAWLAQVLYNFALIGRSNAGTLLFYANALAKKDMTLQQVCQCVHPECIRRAILYSKSLLFEKSNKIGPDGDADIIADLAYDAEDLQGLLIECEIFFSSD